MKRLKTQLNEQTFATSVINSPMKIHFFLLFYGCTIVQCQNLDSVYFNLYAINIGLIEKIRKQFICLQNYIIKQQNYIKIGRVKLYYIEHIEKVKSL